MIQTEKPAAASGGAKQHSTSDVTREHQQTTPEWRSGVGKGQKQFPQHMYDRYDTVYIMIGTRRDGPWTVDSVNRNSGTFNGTYDLTNAKGERRIGVREGALNY
ncbi:hypothetical protein LTR50_004234 [Elasticomyces elasticus]|nr:hypothetical protein LTR50_004234 [Elasticomyces elasticus]